MSERPLSGGRITPGVVQIGDTVRRPTSLRSEFVVELLRLLEQRGFEQAPRYLGQDDAGRDILTYLDGQVPVRFQQWTDTQVAAFGRLLRAFHDATRGSRLAGDHEVVCHHDPGPNNVIFRDELPAALIDFDMAEPGSPLEDIGYAAWTWCVASKEPLETQPGQVKVLVDAYGLAGSQRDAVVDAILDRQLRNARFWTETTVEVTDHQRAERIAWSHREHAFTTTNRQAFEQALA
ncbi:aminoglycoside phosphotransferase family protein [Kribbella capetownensis]|uniref:Aminoglycoside phosphotransferase family protein n=1 Tax=Kribbella capetownensis TaxID=1572659 RepID=A0A4R0JHH9_9ACTN|nr:aminoglycoside phosphotransferase family protein [Kribbella capetownensis]TCC45667.1 aminoglycoside phosphotransferase family protein [Kribbella capetownensis]